MKVWVLLCNFAYDTRNIAAVCATERLAQEEEEMHSKCWADDHSIEEWEVTETPGAPIGAAE